MIPDKSTNLRSRAVVFILGGPVANLLTGFFIVFLKLGGPIAPVFAALSVLVGAANLVPFRRLATAVVRPLAASRVTPNMLTIVGLLC